MKKKLKAGGSKFDSGKVRLELVPVHSIWSIAEVLTISARIKYADYNWTKGILFSKLYGAAYRHLTLWGKGEDTDKEFGYSHLAHLGCCVLFLIWMSKFRPDLDDRFKDPVAYNKRK